MLAKFVNDNAGNLVKRGVCAFFASKLAPTAGLSRGLLPCYGKKADAATTWWTPATTVAAAVGACVLAAARA
ncbi:hypothetical protein C1Y18_20350 [Pseudomonas sp. MPR-R5A]|nr:hypothetical protein C1Y25_20035 [Pseudomonas sp. MPBC4-3]PMX45128.1 hypothetical protein C1Y20_22165 [Pseudomonas sp. FW301-21B01]PMY05215.1 hypothetical protein C1Y18_20350 [Pseudomonas sp. MPR-R5A]PNA66145.1 hypothetical protein C1Y14_21460 [Pseudomonas sp. MPR-R5B]